MRSLLVMRWFVVSRDSTFLPMACKDVNERHHIRIRGTNCYGMTHFRAAISIELPVDPFPPAPIAIRGSVRVPVKPYAALSNTTRVRSTKHNRRCRHARITPRRKSTRPQTKPPTTSPRRCLRWASQATESFRRTVRSFVGGRSSPSSSPSSVGGGEDRSLLPATTVPPASAPPASMSPAKADAHFPSTAVPRTVSAMNFSMSGRPKLMETGWPKGNRGLPRLPPRSVAEERRRWCDGAPCSVVCHPRPVVAAGGTGVMGD